MEKQTMSKFLQQVGTILYRFLRKRGLAHEDAEDIVQDTCYTFLLHQDGIPSSRVMSWLYTVASNKFYDLKRKERRHPSTNADDVILIALSNIPDIHVLEKEKILTVRKTLEKLPIFQQEILVLKYELELSYKEISSLLDMNENTLKTHVRRAKEKFIYLFKEENYDED